MKALPQPIQFGVRYASIFQDASVVTAYPNRVPYPPETFDLLARLAGARKLVIPGHDPLVRQRFPAAFENARPDVRRLDLGVV